MGDAQQELQRRWQYLAKALGLNHSGIFTWQVGSNTLEWSDEAYRILGFTRETHPTLDLIFDRVHPEDRERVSKLRDCAARNGMDLDFEHRLLMPNGDIRYLHVVAHAGNHMPGNREYIGIVTDITERKRADQERQALSRDLEESRARLEEAQRVAHMGHFQWDLIANRMIFSSELHRLFESHLPEGPIDIELVRKKIYPEDRERTFQITEEAIRAGVHVDAEYRIVRSNGDVRTLHNLGTVKRDTLGLAYEYFGTTQDITERKRAEQALQQSQFYLSEGERLAKMGTWASSDLGIRWSDDLGIYWSDEVYKLYGLDPKNGPPNLEQYLALMHPHDRALMVETLKRMHEQRCGCDITKRIIRPDGEVRHVRCVGVPHVEDEVFKGFHGTEMDVTQHELLTQELRREQVHLAEAQRLTHTGSWASNLVTRQGFHSSEENNRLYGFDVSQHPNPFDLHYSSILAEDEPGLRANLENAIRVGADFDVEYRIQRADGAIRFLRGIGHHSPAQEFGEYFGITMDITDRKHAEKEREKLRQLEADLAHINRVNMMGELAAALAHEIKQPIAASITSANALRRWLAHDPPDMERARAAAIRIEQDAIRAADVINSLQSFYKRGIPVQRQIVDVKNVIEEMALLLESEAARHSVVIITEIDDNTPNLLVDRVQLQQVFMNLMLNAIEAMKDSGGELTIKSQVNPEDWLIVSISDAGVGLPEGWSDEIFDPFHSTKPQGTGMGLTITRSIVESYTGRVWATNNQGKGATFHFTLPCQVEAHA